ncbi:MAG TPA: RidA family protein [Sphingobium sp.]|nr:RidA family protein [Sphingobium sp.]
MAGADQKLTELGLILPAPLALPPGVVLRFPWVNVRGKRAYISGHGPQNLDGSVAGPFGSVGEELSVEQGHEAARLTALSMLASLKRTLGSLDRIAGWCRVHGMVNCVPGFAQTPAVLNGFTDLILEVFGPEIGAHARTAIGVAALPHNMPVEIEAELLLNGE